MGDEENICRRLRHNESINLCYSLEMNLNRAEILSLAREVDSNSRAQLSFLTHLPSQEFLFVKLRFFVFH